LKGFDGLLSVFTQEFPGRIEPEDDIMIVEEIDAKNPYIRVENLPNSDEDILPGVWYTCRRPVDHSSAESCNEVKMISIS